MNYCPLTEVTNSHRLPLKVALQIKHRSNENANLISTFTHGPENNIVYITYLWVCATRYEQAYNVPSQITSIERDRSPLNQTPQHTSLPMPPFYTLVSRFAWNSATLRLHIYTFSNRMILMFAIFSCKMRAG